MRLPASEHITRPWRIHELTPDFQLEDVWALPTPGGPDDLSRLVAQFDSMTFPDGAPLPVRMLWAARWKLGGWLGWDGPESGLNERVPSLRDRLPDDLKRASSCEELDDDHPFTALYGLHDEYAAEMANKTVHTVCHFGWVPDGAGGYRGQLAALVKPNGPLGGLYMALIKPLRYWIVYPALLRTIERQWNATTEPDATVG